MFILGLANENLKRFDGGGLVDGRGSAPLAEIHELRLFAPRQGALYANVYGFFCHTC